MASTRGPTGSRAASKASVADASRVAVDVRGVVQGVGFRPFVHELAEQLGLTGWVINTTEGVTAEVQGSRTATRAFVSRLAVEAPPLSFIIELHDREIPTQPGEAGFAIRPSAATATRTALLPPDVCTCDDCARELRDPADRRYRYPFINCTNCGPRYTIVDDIPYDRDKTSMARFAMCDACRAEYEDATNRRFHAQPNACFDCGPRVWVADSQGIRLEVPDPIEHIANLLMNGVVVAIKGLGGFHLAADATNEQAVRRLRARKHREAKPLAIMCRNLDETRRHVEMDEVSTALITSRHRPIVLVPRKRESDVSEAVAPSNPELGVMLPYTPLHMLLLDAGPPALVMTSGNVSEEPIAIGNDEAVRRLGPMADALLLHDREILVRNDDSVIRPMGHGAVFLRRSRGYVPLPVMLRHDGPSVLAVGGELKNTVCLTKGRMAFISQHIGDQANEAAFDAFVDTTERLQRILDVRPGRLAADLHPDYATTRWAATRGLPLVRVQHHHAHVASCLAEHGEAGPVIGLALDGTGYGTDGATWGGELLVADAGGFRRVGHLGYVRQPGGDQAARQPWRMAVSYLIDTFGDRFAQFAERLLGRVEEQRRDAVARLVTTGTNAPLTSSLGRLFDGAAALCGQQLESRFEAQAAMRLEMTARSAPQDFRTWPVEIVRAESLELRPSMFVRPMVEDLARGVDAAVVALRFHRTVAQALVSACEIVRDVTGVTMVAASGGCMQNRLLAELIVDGLRARGFRVLVQEKVPPNDGGLALGQAWVARHGG